MAILVFSGVLAFSANAETKLIRLRNERIETPETPAFSPAAGANAPGPTQSVSGLYLIQFRSHLMPAMRSALEAQHVQLVKYVPDDAFIARLDDANPAAIRALPFVRWLGEYRADYKLHEGLLGPVGMVGAGDINVTLMLASAAPAVERAALRRVFNKLEQESQHRFGGVMRGRVKADRLQQLARSPAVLWIEPGPRMKLVDEIASELVGGEGQPASHRTFTQDYGFDGGGVTVAVADSGLHSGTTNYMHPDLAGRVSAFFFYGDLTDAMDEHSHGTHVTGIIAGNGATGEMDEAGNLYGLGVASGVRIVAQRLFDGAGAYYPPPSFEVMTHDAVRAGAEIGSNSWGDDTQGRYDVSAAEFDALVRDADAETFGDQPYILEFSAGNAGGGAQTIGSPAVAKNVIASGASQNNRFDFFIYDEGSEAMADFSSRGPCEDGRIKPDVVAPGTWIASLRSPVGDDGNAWLDIDSDYLYMGGTSQAGPQVSGAAAVFVQYYRETYPDLGTPSPALVKAALIHSAVDMDDASGTASTPNMDEGWGRVDLTQIILSPRWHEFIDQTNLLMTGQTYERSVVIANTNEPLRVTLVYTDVPGFPAAIPALVNDLDLEMVGPDGRIYRGNQFEGGESVPDAPAGDRLNNVEGIYIGVPAPGEYVLRVKGRNIVQDARSDTPAIDQDFALVVSGNIPPLETGIVLLDRTHYTVPGRIKVKLFDLDLAGVPTANVLIKSATEPNGFTLVLRPFNSSGVFTGSVATATGAVNYGDGKLQIAHGDWIRVEYADASEGVTRAASATADLIAPNITGVVVTNQFGQMVVSWVTDEPATGVVRYGTNSTLNRSVTNNFLTFSHSLELGDLTTWTTNYFVAMSADAAGNIRTNNNGGSLFNFVALPSATVLLVDAYVHNLEDTFIPLSTYTNALNETGVRYDVWSTESRGMPVFNNLRSYQIVMWRLNDSYNSSDLIPTAQQNAIQQHLNGGGAFFMASMEILSRLLNGGGASFVTNVLHVQRFLRNTELISHCLDCDEDFQVPTAVGVSADVVGDAMELVLDYTRYPAVEFFELGPDFADTFGPATNASPFLLEQISGKPCGVRFPRTGADSTGRVAFVSFPLDSIPEFGPPPSTRSSFLRRVFQFLAPGLDGLGTVALDQDSYRLPDLITVEVGDSDLAGLAGATVQIHSSSFSNRIAVALAPTSKPGLLRGFIPVVSGTNAPSTNKLRAYNGDTVVVEYFDASGHVTLQSTAVIDAVSPSITNLDLEVGYQHAIVMWNTSERTDSLVQYGESKFLGKTAYLSELALSHEVQLTGLTPDRLYYYKIVSRDVAGNVVEDDNNGELHTFETLRPLSPPFVDRMQNGGTNWSVFNGEDTQFVWRIGSPQNGLVANTPSGDATAWSTKLNADPADTIDTFLISPAIDLTGGNVARLRFMHAYDFSERTPFDILEGGELLIITNAISAPAAQIGRAHV